MKKRSYRYILGIVIITAAGATALAWSSFASYIPSSAANLHSAAAAPSSSSTPQGNSATLVISDGTDVMLHAAVPVSGTSTIFSVLQSATESSGMALSYRDYPGMGYLVTKIGDKVNGVGGSYWQYWVNGVYAQEGADHTPARTGDVIDWKFVASQQ